MSALQRGTCRLLLVLCLRHISQILIHLTAIFGNMASCYGLQLVQAELRAISVSSPQKGLRRFTV